jgi:syntaxin-binding protein 1
MGGASKVAEPVGDYLSKKIAVQVQNDLDEYMANNPEFPVGLSRPQSCLISAMPKSTLAKAIDANVQTASSRTKATLFIIDRSIDPVAPLLHEFWYQAMVNDLLPVKDGISYKCVGPNLRVKMQELISSYTYTNTVGGKETKTAQLTEADPVWTSVRHLHMKDAIDTLMTDFGRFAQEHAGFSG